MPSTEFSKQIGSTDIRLQQGNIVQQQVDAIVNAANSSLLGGGGVDGAIHRAGGSEILEECRKIRAAQGGCRPGEAVITGAGKLNARHVVHTVGPVWQGGQANEPETLANAYRRSLEVAAEAGDRTVAFPSISTGAYGYPVDKAAAVATKAVADYCRSNPGTFTEVRFVLFDEGTMKAFETALADS